jgi:cytochrome P450
VTQSDLAALARFDPFDPELQADPFAYYALCRREAPVYQDSDSGIFFVSSYEHVRDAMERSEDFSNEFAMADASREAGRRAGGDAGSGWALIDTMGTANPPEPKSFRSVVTRALQMKRVRALEPRIFEIAESLVDRFVGRGQVELRREFAVPLPLRLIAEQLGVPTRDMPLFKTWSEAFVRQLSAMATPEELTQVDRHILEFQRYFAKVLEGRRVNRQDDIISDLVHASSVGGRPLDIAATLSILQQLLVAGNETTAAALMEGMLLFIRHPDQLAKLEADPSLLPGAIEEILRLASPMASMWRRCKHETELGGVTIPAGSMCLLRLISANRDEQVFSDPERFDIERSNASDHLSFGYGTHFCLGVELARAELREGFGELLRRITNPRLVRGAEPPRHIASILHWGLAELRIQFDAR